MNDSATAIYKTIDLMLKLMFINTDEEKLRVVEHTILTSGNDNKEEYIKILSDIREKYNIQ